MYKTFKKLAELVGVKNAYKWMCEAGKISSDFLAELSFAELEEIFGSGGKELSEAEKLAILRFMAEKASKAREFAKTSLLYKKIGEQEKAREFLEKAEKKASIDDWAWMFRRYEIDAIGDENYAALRDVAKKKIVEKILE